MSRSVLFFVFEGLVFGGLWSLVFLSLRVLSSVGSGCVIQGSQWVALWGSLSFEGLVLSSVGSGCVILGPQ